jgi:transcription initiation factor TFIIIB Brf1 subunit/transcription initiation factor TFIIB
VQQDGFRIIAQPRIVEATCRGCGASLVEVRDGWVSTAYVCEKCKAVFKLKLIKLPDSKVDWGVVEEKLSRRQISKEEE